MHNRHKAFFSPISISIALQFGESASERLSHMLEKKSISRVEIAMAQGAAHHQLSQM
jgi:hypothetical protein